MFEYITSCFSKKTQQSMIFEITLKCNLDCKYCYNVCKNATPYKTEELNTEDTKKLIDKIIKDTGCSHFTFTGGEPYLRKDFFELLEHASTKEVNINIISNGTLLSEENVMRSLKSNVSIFELPLLSSERAIHNSLVNNDSFDRVTEAIAYIKAHGGRVVTVFVATKENLHTWKNTIDMALALGADGIMFNRFNPGGMGRNNIEKLLPSPEDLEVALEIANKAVEEYGISISCSIAMHPCLIQTEKYPNLGFGYCAAGTSRAYYTVDAVGNVRMCNHSQIIIGNILEKPFNKFAHNKIARDFMKAYPAFCSDCSIVKDCQGGCKAAAEVCYGSPYKEDPFLKLNKEKALKK